MDRIFPKDYINQIFQGDCLDLMGELPDGAVALILTDPPYGIRYQNQFAAAPHPMLEGDRSIDYGRFAKESYRILAPDSHAYFFTRFDCYPYHYQCLKDAGFVIKNCLVIEKGTLGGIGDLQGSFANNSEWVIFCQKGRRTFNHTTLLRNLNRRGCTFTKGEIPAHGIKPVSLPAGSGRSIPKPPITRHGRSRTGFSIPPSKIWSAWPG